VHRCLRATALFFALLGPGAPLVRAAEGASAPAPNATPAEVDAKVRVAVSDPRPGVTVRGRFDMVQIAGIAQAGARDALFDVVLVLDISGSAAQPSGIDVDGDGELGVAVAPLIRVGNAMPENSDPGDSILAAEILGARRLLEALDPGRVNVGVVTFSGEFDRQSGTRVSLEQVDAQVDLALTNDYDQVRLALDTVQARGVYGGTNLEAGIKRALFELAGLEGAVSTPRPDARKVIIILTDGAPSLPFGSVAVSDPEDITAAIEAARLAESAGVVINVFGLGPSAIDYPVAPTEVTRVTNGVYVPVRRAGDIVTVLSGISFANVDDVVAVNLTLGEEAHPDDVILQPDGSFRGFVPVRPGVNRIRISAMASDGSRGSTDLEVNFQHQDLTDDELEAELDRVRKRNRDIRMVSERERQKVERERVRERDLELEVEGEPKPAPAPNEPAPPSEPKPKP